MQDPATGLAEVGGEERDREAYEHRQHGPPAADRLLIEHGSGTSRRRLLAPAAVLGIFGAAVNGLELLEAAPRPDRHARERRLGQVGGHLRLVAQALVEPLEQ